MNRAASVFIWLFVWVCPFLCAPLVSATVAGFSITMDDAYCVPGYNCGWTVVKPASVSTYKVELYEYNTVLSNSRIGTLSSSTSTTGSATWTISAASLPLIAVDGSTRYVLRLTSLTDASTYVESGTFVFTPFKLLTMTPVTGSTYVMGQQFSLTWQIITIGTAQVTGLTATIKRDVIGLDPDLASFTVTSPAMGSATPQLPIDMSTSDISNCYLHIGFSYQGSSYPIDYTARFTISVPPALVITFGATPATCIAGLPCTLPYTVSSAVGSVTIEVYRHNLVSTDTYITTLTGPLANSVTSVNWTPSATLTTGSGVDYYYKLSGSGTTQSYKSDYFSIVNVRFLAMSATAQMGQSLTIQWQTSPAGYGLSSTATLNFYRDVAYAVDPIVATASVSLGAGTYTWSIPLTLSLTADSYYAALVFTKSGTSLTSEQVSRFTIYPSASSNPTATPAPTTTATTTPPSSSSTVAADQCCRDSACNGVASKISFGSITFCCPQGGSQQSYNLDCNCGGVAQACNGGAAPTPTTAQPTTGTSAPTSVPTTSVDAAGNGSGGGNSNSGTSSAQSSSSSSVLPIAIGASVGGVVLIAIISVVVCLKWRKQQGRTRVGSVDMGTNPHAKHLSHIIPAHYPKQANEDPQLIKVQP